MNIHLIAAVGLRGQIGLNGQVPWHNDPTFSEQTKRDLETFARMTEGGVLIMGSKTAASLPKGFRANGRRIMILSRTKTTFDMETVAEDRMMDPLTCIAHINAQTRGGRDIFICGGREVYAIFAPHVDWHHISVFPYNGPADTYMPPILPFRGHR